MNPFGREMLGQVPLVRSMGDPFFHGPRWGVYQGRWVRWPDCDPRYDAQCPFPTTFIVEGSGPPPVPSLGQGPVVGFGGPSGSGFGFGGGPGGLIGDPGPVVGAPAPPSGPVSGPSIPCGPAGYGPSCAWPNPDQTVVQKVYPIDGILGRRALGRGGSGGMRFRNAPRAPGQEVCGPGETGPGCYPVENLGEGPTSHGTAARGRDLWYHPNAPCPPGFFRSAPGAPCVSPGSEEDWGEDYWVYGDKGRYVDMIFR